MNEIHKMPDWKNWLKGVIDGRARMETWRQSGNSRAERYLPFRLHPISVREWCEQRGGTPGAALDHLMLRGGFPEPCLAPTPEDADRGRRKYFTDLI